MTDSRWELNARGQEMGERIARGEAVPKYELLEVLGRLLGHIDGLEWQLESRPPRRRAPAR